MPVIPPPQAGFTSRKLACSLGRAGCGGRECLGQTSRSSEIENVSSKCTFCPGLLSAILVLEAACRWWCASCSSRDLTLVISSANSVPTSFGTWNSVPSYDRRRSMSRIPSRWLFFVESSVCRLSWTSDISSPFSRCACSRLSESRGCWGGDAASAVVFLNISRIASLFSTTSSGCISQLVVLTKVPSSSLTILRRSSSLCVFRRAIASSWLVGS